MDAERAKREKEKELHPSKVRVCALCADCGRPRCIYLKTSVGVKLHELLAIYLEDVDDRCGDTLLDEGSTPVLLEKLNAKFYHRAHITCCDLMEKDNYNYGGLHGQTEFEHVCSLCGKSNDESPLVDVHVLSAAVTEGKTALPLCSEYFKEEKTSQLVKRSDKRKQIAAAHTKEASSHINA
ncbi:MAG: hypothetical protein SGPRY_008981 [Prymnesium sp.]